MKQKQLILLAAFILAASANSCKKDEPIETKANLHLSLKQEVFSRDGKTSEEDFSIDNYVMTVNGVETEIPADGILPELEAGQYEIELTDYDGNFTPAFNAGKHSGKVTAEVKGGADSNAEIILEHINAGIYFSYDESLSEIGLSEVSPMISNGNESLDYSADREGIGYFMPGTLTVSFTLDGRPVDIGGQESAEIEVKAGELWAINLKAPSSAATKAEYTSLEIVPVLIVDPTNKEDWELGCNTVTEFTVASMSGKDVTLILKNSGEKEITFDDKGTAILSTTGSDIVTGMVTAQNDTIHIGRITGEKIVFDYDGEKVTYREDSDGKALIGIAEELMMPGTDNSLLALEMKQEADLYLDGIDWKPIGPDFSNPFTGSLDGNGFKIHNLTINMPDMQYVGLFGITTDATFDNITIASGNILGGRYNGAIAARLTKGEKGSKMSNCKNYATVRGTKDNTGGLVGQCYGEIAYCENHGDISGWGQVGGIAAMVTGTLTDCINYGNIHSTEETDTGNSVGGIASNANGNFAIKNCINEGTIKGKGSIAGICSTLGSQFTVESCTNNGEIIFSTHSAGGIAAGFGGGATLTNCINNGTISGEGDQATTAGGIAGVASEGAELHNCTNSESAKIENVKEYIGGIVGNAAKTNLTYCTNNMEMNYPEASFVGSIAGSSTANISFCINNVKVNAKSYAGGITGQNGEGAKLRMCENNAEITATEFAGGIAGITYGTVSASINRAKISGGQYIGGLCGGVSGPYSYLLASYNTGTIEGTSEAGGVCGIVRQVGLVEACYSVADVKAESLFGGVCGNLMTDEAAEIKCSFWSGFNGAGTTDNKGEVYYFDDGTEAPEGANVSWPVESVTNWGISPEGNDGKNSLWWKDLGTEGSQDYPLLWWEE